MRLTIRNFLPHSQEAHLFCLTKVVTNKADKNALTVMSDGAEIQSARLFYLEHDPNGGSSLMRGSSYLPVGLEQHNLCVGRLAPVRFTRLADYIRRSTQTVFYQLSKFTAVENQRVYFLKVWLNWQQMQQKYRYYATLAHWGYSSKQYWSTYKSNSERFFAVIEKETTSVKAYKYKLLARQKLQANRTRAVQARRAARYYPLVGHYVLGSFYGIRSVIHGLAQQASELSNLVVHDRNYAKLIQFCQRVNVYLAEFWNRYLVISQKFVAFLRLKSTPIIVKKFISVRSTSRCVANIVGGGVDRALNILFVKQAHRMWVRGVLKQPVSRFQSGFGSQAAKSLQLLEYSQAGKASLFDSDTQGFESLYSTMLNYSSFKIAPHRFKAAPKRRSFIEMAWPRDVKSWTAFIKQRVSYLTLYMQWINYYTPSYSREWYWYGLYFQQGIRSGFWPNSRQCGSFPKWCQRKRRFSKLIRSAMFFNAQAMRKDVYQTKLRGFGCGRKRQFRWMRRQAERQSRVIAGELREVDSYYQFQTQKFVKLRKQGLYLFFEQLFLAKPKPVGTPSVQQLSKAARKKPTLLLQRAIFFSHLHGHLYYLFNEMRKRQYRVLYELFQDGHYFMCTTWCPHKLLQRRTRALVYRYSILDSEVKKYNIPRVYFYKTHLNLPKKQRFFIRNLQKKLWRRRIRAATLQKQKNYYRLRIFGGMGEKPQQFRYWFQKLQTKTNPLVWSTRELKAPRYAKHITRPLSYIVRLYDAIRAKLAPYRIRHQRTRRWMRQSLRGKKGLWEYKKAYQLQKEMEQQPWGLGTPSIQSAMGFNGMVGGLKFLALPKRKRSVRGVLGPQYQIERKKHWLRVFHAKSAYRKTFKGRIAAHVQLARQYTFEKRYGTK